MRRLMSIFEPFVLALLATLLLASVVPVRGALVPTVGLIADIGIALLFFLHGAKLSREAIRDGATNWKLHLAVLTVTFALFPLLGLGFMHFGSLERSIAIGVLFLTLLPSTVQSSIAFTAIAGGNVAAAVWSATFSNLIGIFLTPLLVGLLIAGSGNDAPAFSGAAVQTIAVQLLLPFIAGHLLRPVIGGFVARHKSLVTRVDRGSILLVVYTAFSAAVVDGLWSRISGITLVQLLLICLGLLAAVMASSYALGRSLRLNREDAIVLLFCGSKKSLATGVPIAGVLFSASQVGVIILPLMLFHQIQLIVCAFIARRLSAAAPRSMDGSEA